MKISRRGVPAWSEEGALPGGAAQVLGGPGGARGGRGGRSRPVLGVRGDAQVSRAQFAGQVFDLQLNWKEPGPGEVRETQL